MLQHDFTSGAQAELNDTDHAAGSHGDPFRSVTEPAPETDERIVEEPTHEPEPQPEATRRRGSTVREPVRFDYGEPSTKESNGSGPPEPEHRPESQPSTNEQSQIAPERPRRTGWWSRR
jgi:hypothetical protein